MPKIVLPNVDAFSEEDRAHATRNEDGSYTIDVRPTQVITEFRENNLKYKQDLDNRDATLKNIAKFFDMEIADVKELDETAIGNMVTEMKAIKQQVADGKLVADSSLEAAIAQRVQEHKTESENRIRDLNTELNKRDTKLKGLAAEMDDYVRTQEISMAVMDPKSDVRPEALPDILARARPAFKVDGNKKLIPIDAEGRTVYGPDAQNPLTVQEWLRGTLDKAPHFSKTSRGGGTDNLTGDRMTDLASTADTGSYVESRLRAMNPGADGVR